MMTSTTNHPPAWDRVLLLGELRCGRCSSRLAEEDAACAHCGLAFADPARPETGGAAVSRLPGLRGLAAAAWILVAGTSLAWTAAAWSGPEALSPEERCADALEDLRIRLASLDPSAVPASTGAAFLEDVAACTGGEPLDGCPGGAAYRGPARPWASLAADGVVACDPEGAHADGLRYLTRDGRIRTASAGSPEQARVLAETSGRQEGGMR